jgi:hypothetical protein
MCIRSETLIHNVWRRLFRVFEYVYLTFACKLNSCCMRKYTSENTQYAWQNKLLHAKEEVLVAFMVYLVVAAALYRVLLSCKLSGETVWSLARTRLPYLKLTEPPTFGCFMKYMAILPWLHVVARKLSELHVP